ncbi:MAG: hypothetical protein INR71_08240, partial [Terriglobus roseus]|nr:hypothetical protein [Terriglobus roseus]
MTPRGPEALAAVEGRYAVGVLLQRQRGLGEDIGAAQMGAASRPVPAVLVGGFYPAQPEVAEGQEVHGISVFWIQRVQAGGGEEGVLVQVVVEMVADDLAQLRRHEGVGGRHGERSAGVCEEEDVCVQTAGVVVAVGEDDTNGGSSSGGSDARGGGGRRRN